MANITTKLPISFDGNNIEPQYTRYKDVLEFNVKASAMNYLPLSSQKLFVKNNANITFKDNYFYCPLSSAGAWAYQFGLPTLKMEMGKRYTIYFEKKNSSNQNLDFVIIIGDRTHNCSNTGGIISYTMTGSDGFNKLTFSPNYSENQYIWIANSGNTSGNAFDLYIYGIFEYNEEHDYGLVRRHSSASSNPKIISSNTPLNTVGNYEISREVNRHLKQIERKIVDLHDRDIFNITWR